LKAAQRTDGVESAAAVQAGSFFLDVFEDLGSGKRWQLRRGQHTIDDRR